ncbi:uncharacterized protein LOC122019930 isoform X3 [Zingiber officinale]|uniref:uncharacterized protein LOC122019930 isoform X3 n=1 Tax=Zingiber officinale TaxID=94328 RepID=UPI001C4C2759|nr:uncharacterized protein LOC122019930 isoform X3 [Zingiber officinale]
MKRSSDWSIYELEEDARNDFDTEGDHIVSIQGCEILCKHKKSEHETYFKKSKYGPETYQISADAAISYIVMTSAFDNVIPLENVHSSVAKNFNLHDWLEIDNFTDVERMFREHDSTFGQRHVKCIDEVSQVSCSSDMVDGSVLGYLNDILEEDYSSSSYFPEFGPSKQNGSQYSSKDAVIQRYFIPKEQLTPSSNKFKNNANSTTPYEHLVVHVLGHQESTVPSALLPDIRIEKLPEMQSYYSEHTEDSHHDTQTTKAVAEKYDKLEDSLASRGLKALNNVLVSRFNSKATQGSCLVAAMSSHDVFEEALGFRQLWNVMIQLNVTTKLCIRDGLYGLAEIAAQSNICSEHNESFATREMDAVAINKCKKTITENERNSTDQSVAHLLFQKPLPFISSGCF